MHSDKFIESLAENFKVWSSEQLRKLQNASSRLSKEWQVLVLCKAASKGKTLIISELFTNYSPKEYINLPNPKDPKLNSALMYAAATNQIDAFMLLIENGASIYRKNLEKETPLTLAYRKGHNLLIEAYLENPETGCIEYYDEFGNSIIEYAFETNNIDFARYLVSKPKGPKVDVSIACPIAHHWEFNKVPLADKQLTPLLRSIISGNYNIAQSLLSIGASSSIRAQSCGTTPFRATMEMCRSGNGHPRFKEILLNFIQQKTTLTNSTVHFESDLLYIIEQIFQENEKTPGNCSGFYFEILQNIMSIYNEENIDVDYFDEKLKITALGLSVRYCLKDVVLLLVNKGANPLSGIDYTQASNSSPYNYEKELANVEHDYHLYVPSLGGEGTGDDRDECIPKARSLIFSWVNEMACLHAELLSFLEETSAHMYTEITSELDRHTVASNMQGIIFEYYNKEFLKYGLTASELDKHNITLGVQGIIFEYYNKGLPKNPKKLVPNFEQTHVSTSSCASSKAS